MGAMTVRILGFDFTSAPSLRKPITVATGTLNKGKLAIEAIETLESFQVFEARLTSPSCWIAGMDFPFGQPRKLVENLGWPLDWTSYVRNLPNLGKAAFEQMLNDYRDGQPEGNKHHFRATDRLACSCSPMMLSGVPVAKMFFEGAPRLLYSEASVVPCRSEAAEPRIVVEAYPKLVAAKCVGACPYKTDSKNKQKPGHGDTRRRIVNALRSKYLGSLYGFQVVLKEEYAESAAEDPTGDRLDAILCAIQAAWAYEQRESVSYPYGVPVDCDKLEGWIVDPAQLL